MEMATLPDRLNEASLVLDAIPVAVILLDDVDCIALVNSAAEDLIGRSTSGLIGAKLSSVLNEDSSLLDFVAQARSQGGVVSKRGLRLTGAQIAPVTVDVTASPEGIDNRLTLCFLPARANSDDAAAEVGAFAQIAKTLGHEVKNPLAGIVGAAQLLARNAEDEQQPLLSLIRKEGARIERIVDRFTAFETFFNPRFKPTNVHEILDSVVALAKAGFARKTSFDLQFDPSLPEIMIDPDHLHEACLNLVKNAVEAAASVSHKPRIIVTTRYRAGFRFARGDAPRSRGALEISIADNGPGIPDSTAKHIFEPFYTTKSGGMGIGLAVITEIMSAHDGFVLLDNLPGGACFRLLFPINHKKESSSE